ncbi:MAG: hypothetical protein KME26_13275 [Oscillatoria princeps RMCB-10]|nr:hypothetical protein [Oscillatoria princeps RMCB-10]
MFPKRERTPIILTAEQFYVFLAQIADCQQYPTGSKGAFPNRERTLPIYLWRDCRLPTVYDRLKGCVPSWGTHLTCALPLIADCQQYATGTPCSRLDSASNLSRIRQQHLSNRQDLLADCLKSAPAKIAVRRDFTIRALALCPAIP